MRRFLCLFILLTTPALAQAAESKPAILKFEKAIDGATFEASGERISLWGVKAVDPSSRYFLASRLYLETMLRFGSLSCIEAGRAGDVRVMRCDIDKSDVGSLVVQMGMATASDPYYEGEQDYARRLRRGVWNSNP